MSKILTKRRLRSLIRMISLVLIAVVLNVLHRTEVLEKAPLFPTIMTLSTAAYIAVTCILQNSQSKVGFIISNVVVFLMLCMSLLYCVAFIDFAVFGICIALVLQRILETCSCYWPNRSSEP